MNAAEAGGVRIYRDGFMGSPEYRVPAIVMGRGPTALGILRCLRLAGVPAYVACPSDDHVARSRWYRPTPGSTPWDGSLGPDILDVLRRMPLEQAVLIPSADDAALWLANLPQSDLGERFRVSTSSRLTQEILQDKSRFAAFLQTTDIPHPRTFRIDSAADIDAMPFDELDRVFVKPVNSQIFSDVLGVKGIWVKRREDLHDVWNRLQDHNFRLMAQEYVPGGPDNHYFVDGFRDAGGTLSGMFTRRRIRMHPADFGNSSYCRSIPLTELQAPVDNMTALLSQLDYRGIFSAEFKRDARDGAYRIIEVNTRAWTYVEFAARCGVNVCDMAYRDALGLPVAMASRNYRVGAGCVDLHRDLSAVLTQKAATRGPLPRILKQWAGAHFHSFRFDDSRPGLSTAHQILSHQWKQRFGS
jgi:predicted ATP-grasp superfamily ATP-dependent carboligase